MKVKRIRDVKLPTRGTSGSCGFDFYIPNDTLWETTIIQSGGSLLVPSGIKVEVPQGYMLCSFNKSGIALKKNLVCGASVIDIDYQGEINLHLINVGNSSQIISRGEKIVQFILVKISMEQIEEVDEIHLVETERGDGGFGSTGVK